jgi:hypothetical protein
MIASRVTAAWRASQRHHPRRVVHGRLERPAHRDAGVARNRSARRSPAAAGRARACRRRRMRCARSSRKLTPCGAV